MKRVRISIALFTALILIPIVVQAFQTQRAQIGVAIIIDATPNPLGFVGPPAPASAIIAKARLEGAPPAVERAFEAQQLHFTSLGKNVVAQVQKSVKVEASIQPNPAATLLYSDQTAVVIPAEAGIATAVTCAYHVYVHTTITSWTLKQGLSADFSDGAGDSFLGGNVANNTYLVTPLPTATPFVVYADDGGLWSSVGTGGGIETYCVDLTIDMPITTPQGTYSSNAIYTLYY